MSKKTDVLDELRPDYAQVGRHRARKTTRERLIELMWLAVASATLSAGGYLGLQYAVASLASPVPEKKIIKGIDYSIPITVMDGTGTRKYASSVGQELLDADYVVPYSRTLDNQLPKTLIAIRSEDYRALAKRMRAVLGNLPIQLNTAAKYPIEVRLGQDYTPLG